MKRIALVLVSALALAACSKTDKPAANDAEKPAAEQSPAASGGNDAAGETGDKAADGKTVTKEYLVGKWSQPDGSCDMPVQYNADGTATGAPFDKWELADGVLSMDILGEPAKWRVAVIDADTMQITSLTENSTTTTDDGKGNKTTTTVSGSGKTGTVKRCK
ncbi:MAG: hypothetical protein LBV50_11175 [Novosphingobium sp.]|jgi:hypothetical protein|nr:hypothetical protein [Novosphingobium sp.]